MTSPLIVSLIAFRLLIPYISVRLCLISLLFFPVHYLLANRDVDKATQAVAKMSTGTPTKKQPSQLYSLESSPNSASSGDDMLDIDETKKKSSEPPAGVASKLPAASKPEPAAASNPSPPAFGCKSLSSVCVFLLVPTHILFICSYYYFKANRAMAVDQERSPSKPALTKKLKSDIHSPSKSAVASMPSVPPAVPSVVGSMPSVPSGMEPIKLTLPRGDSVVLPVGLGITQDLWNTYDQETRKAVVAHFRLDSIEAFEKGGLLYPLETESDAAVAKSLGAGWDATIESIQAEPSKPPPASTKPAAASFVQTPSSKPPPASRRPSYKHGRRRPRGED